MFQVQAQSKFDNPVKQARLYYIMGAGVLTTIIGFFYYQSPWIAASILICFAAIYVILSLPSVRLNLVISDSGLQVSSEVTLPYESCLGWAMVDLGNYFELVVQTTEARQPFNYFYIPKSSPQLQNFLVGLAQVIPYEEEIPLRDRIHLLFRRVGLK